MISNSSAEDVPVRTCRGCGSDVRDNMYCGSCGLAVTSGADVGTAEATGVRRRIGPRVLVFGGIGLVVVAALVVAIVLATTGDSDGAPTELADSSTSSAVQICADKWNSGATNSAKRLMALQTRNSQGGSSPTYVSISYSADVPDRCLITVAQPDIASGGSASQFTETANGTFDYPGVFGVPIASLPESVKQWNATGDARGELSVSTP